MSGTKRRKIFRRAPLLFLALQVQLVVLMSAFVTVSILCSLDSFSPPHLHLTTSKVMVIVWRFRGNIIRTVLYIANLLPLQWAQLTKTVHTARLGLEFVFLCFLG